jgi:sulfide:quinone oxidoreductase
MPIPYDHLLVAVGARRRAAVLGALTFRGPGDAEAVTGPLEDVAKGRAESLVIAVPSAAAWSLPAYELAVMAAVELRSRGLAEPRVAIVTPEERPLAVFGRTASAAVADLLAERGIAFHGGRSPAEAAEGELRMRDGSAIAAGRVVALPEAVGPYLPGLPVDALGFIPADEHALVAGYDNVYAAGDATTFPLRQGGLAAQQADAAAESIACGLGALARARPFRPVLRAMLLTGGAPLYLRTVVGEPDGTIGRRPLWWPPAKLAGRYLAPLMATARPPSVTAAPLEDIGAIRHPSSPWRTTA